MKNYLGIDWGEKRIGLALANSENKLATPFIVVGNISKVFDIINKENINNIIIGNPQKMLTGKVDNLKFEKFIKILKEKLENKKISIELIDERLSSVQADSLRVEKIKQDRDSVSAMIILQAYLDKKYG